MVTGDRIVRAPSVSSDIRKLAGNGARADQSRAVPSYQVGGKPAGAMSPEVQGESYMRLSVYLDGSHALVQRKSTQSCSVPRASLLHRGGRLGCFWGWGGCRRATLGNRGGLCASAYAGCAIPLMATTAAADITRIIMDRTDARREAR